MFGLKESGVGIAGNMFTIMVIGLNQEAKKYMYQESGYNTPTKVITGKKVIGNNSGC